MTCSDADFLMAMETPNGGKETSLEISAAFLKQAFSVDIIVCPRAVLEKCKKRCNWFLIDAAKMGKVLYERADKRMG